MADLPEPGLGDVPGALARTYLLVAVGVGVAVGVVTSVRGEQWPFALLLGWIAGGVTYLVWKWIAIWPMDAPTTARHAVREDPGRAVMDALVLLSAVAGLAAVGLLLTGDPGHRAAARPAVVPVRHRGDRRDDRPAGRARPLTV